MGYVEFDDLRGADLVVGDVCRGGSAGTVADDPISKLCHVGNAGGFRARGSWSVPGAQLVAIYSTGNEQAWPDHLDRERSHFLYYGDNRDVGTTVEEALEGKPGNRLLRQTFDALRTQNRGAVPPILIFRKLASPTGRDVEFLGLAAPGAEGMGADEELIAFWSGEAKRRFLNYRATFSILDARTVTRAWIDEIRDTRRSVGAHAPPAWLSWVESGEYRTLRMQ